jgi:hypothetical protein
MEAKQEDEKLIFIDERRVENTSSNVPASLK